MTIVTKDVKGFEELERKELEKKLNQSKHAKAKNVLKHLRIADATSDLRLRYTHIQKAQQLSSKYKKEGVI